MKTQLVILGGGTDPRGCPLGRAYALVMDDATYLLDCGDACGDRLRPEGIDPLSVGQVFITHMHYDHMAGLFGFLFGVWGHCRREEDVPPAIREWSKWGRLSPEQLPECLDVWVPQEGVAPLRQFLPAVYLAPELWRFPLQIRPIQPGLFYQDERIRVSAHLTGHLSSQPLNLALPEHYPGMTLESYGFAIDVGGTRLVYSGDLALSGEGAIEEFRPHAQVADVIVTEMAHVPMEAHMEMLAATDARRIVLVHVHANLVERVRAYVRRQDDERFVLAENGMHLEV